MNCLPCSKEGKKLGFNGGLEIRFSPRFSSALFSAQRLTMAPDRGGLAADSFGCPRLKLQGRGPEGLHRG